MIRVIVVCEGQTEETFIRDVIAPLLAHQHIYLTARLVPTTKGHKGGALSYFRVKRFILNCLKEETETVVTTFFDLYALDNEFPRFVESQTIVDVYQKVAYLESEFKQDIAQENHLFSERFIPYIQPYEFEGLLFTDIQKLIEFETDWRRSLAALQTVRNSFPTPEHINDGYDTKPSKQLENHLTKIKYRKTLHGPLAIQSIGINNLCEQCKHFSEWYQQLNQLGSA
ncbi:MAG: DUF4276 family protein [Methyloglobulus sp.]|nr:DUF4276 family protein [Methyloglobulus sp.]